MILPLLCFLLLPQSDAQALSPDAVQHAKAGLAARQAGHLDEAIAEFRKVTELAPQFPAAFVNLGAAYLEKRNYADAIPALRRALELNDQLAGAHQMLGYALLAQGYAADAITQFEKAGDTDGLGVAQLKAGLYAEALPNLEAALRKHPGDPDLLYYAGRAAGLLGKQNIDTLIASQPDSARSHQALGDNLAALRRVPEAEHEYLEALRLRPGTPGIHLALGVLYSTAGDWVKAESEFAEEAHLQPGDAETAYRHGYALLQNGKASAAMAELNRSDKLRPDMPETLYALGKAAALDDKRQDALKAWKRLLAIEDRGPLAAQAHFGLATLYRKQGDTAAASKEMAEFDKLQASQKPAP